MSAACSAYGIRLISVKDRMKRHGETFEEALEHYVTHGKAWRVQSHKISFNGRDFESLAEACRELGIPYGSVRQRMRLHDETVSEVIEHYVKMKS